MNFRQRFSFFLTVFLSFNSSLIFAQNSNKSASDQSTLTEKLIAEDATQIAHQARESGDIVRGAILFHQGNINCARCHRPAAGKTQLGPDLSKLDLKMTDETIIESILEPSKVIAKGYASKVVLHVDGRTLVGPVVEKTEDEIVLGDYSGQGLKTKIAVDDIEASRDSKVSGMPANLIDELKNRQQFLDLVKYVLDLKERGPEKASAAVRVAERELSDEAKGLVLIQQLNCAACHDAGSVSKLVKTSPAPRLKWSAKWVNPQYLEDYIADPNHAKPGGKMPQLLGHLDRATREKTAKELAHYLISTTTNKFKRQPIDPSAVDRGFKKFNAVGCVACHAPRNESAVELAFEDSIPLGDLSSKYNLSGLINFLENPHVARPSGYMPDLQLTHREALDVSSFLLQSPRSPARKQWHVNQSLVAAGKSHFATLGCANCHTQIATGSVVTAKPTELALNKSDTSRGCLAAKPTAQSKHVPNFHLTEDQRRFIVAAIANRPFKITDQQRIDHTLAAFNCHSCHQRDQVGGVSAERNPYFKTTNLNLGDQGRIPPTLTGVGAKLKRKWMRDVLVNGRSVRPYSKTRMPQFGEENIGHLVDLFQNNDKLPAVDFATLPDTKAAIKQGLHLVGNKGLNCVACHTHKFQAADTMPAVDLTEMAERLKKDWFYEYMLDPQTFSPNTVMPSFWPDGKAIRPDLAGKPAEQLEEIWLYLLDGRQSRTPAGVVREKLEIVVTDEAKMLRRKYPGIGKRGIGVGYPGAVNIAFDAEQLRLASLWRGKFVDPGSAWNGQGSGDVKPLGSVIEFARGPELDDQENPWVWTEDGRSADHHFKGYTLDAKRQPTFQYQFESVNVTDFFQPIAVRDLPAAKADQQHHLRRTVNLAAADGRKGLRFRLGSGPKITQLAERIFAINERLKILVESDQQATVVDVEGGQSLELHFDLLPGQKQAFVFDYLWE